MKLLGAIALVCAGASTLATAKAPPPHSTAELAKRGVVGDVFLGLGDAFKSNKIDLNGALLKGVDGLRSVSSTIDFNKAVNKGFSDAINQNTQLTQIPLGGAVGGVVKQMLAGIDYNSLITGDVMNFLEGASRQVNANAVAISGVDALAAALDGPTAAGTPSGNATSPVKAAGSTSGPKPKGKGPASASVRLVGPLSNNAVGWCAVLALSTLAVVYVL